MFKTFVSLLSGHASDMNDCLNVHLWLHAVYQCFITLPSSV